MAVITSPGFSPDTAAGEPVAIGCWQSWPGCGAICAPAAPVVLVELRQTPTYACSTFWPAMISLATLTSALMGVARPTPELEPSPPGVVLLVSIWSLRPIPWAPGVGRGGRGGRGGLGP